MATNRGIIAASRRKNSGICVSGLTAYLSTGPSNNSVDACMDGPNSNFTRYHNGSGLSPILGDTVYTDNTGCTPFVGFDLWYSDTFAFVAYQINNSGELIGQVVCNP
jgi:hypothetical protein